MTRNSRHFYDFREKPHAERLYRENAEPLFELWTEITVSLIGCRR